MTFAASATIILDTGNVPAVIISLYNLSISCATSGLLPLVIFTIFVSVRSLSPVVHSFRAIATKNSLLKIRLLPDSKMGTHISSVAPGYTVDS